MACSEPLSNLAEWPSDIELILPFPALWLTPPKTVVPGWVKPRGFESWKAPRGHQVSFMSDAKC